MSNNSRTLSIALILIIIIVAGGAAFWFFAQQSITSPETAQPAANIPDQKTDRFYQDKVVFPPTPPEEAEVFAYTGTITDIEATSGKITLRTERGIKYVSLDSNTRLVQRPTLTQQERKNLTTEEISKILQSEQNYFGLLDVDMVITATSNQNIQGKTEFTASKITVINT